MVVHYNNKVGSAAHSVIELYNEEQLRKIYTLSCTSKPCTRVYDVVTSGYSIHSLLKGSIEPQAYDIFGGFTSHMSDIKTSWVEVPYHWNANMIINVRTL